MAEGFEEHSRRSDTLQNVDTNGNSMDQTGARGHKRSNTSEDHSTLEKKLRRALQRESEATQKLERATQEHERATQERERAIACINETIDRLQRERDAANEERDAANERIPSLQQQIESNNQEIRDLKHRLEQQNASRGDAVEGQVEQEAQAQARAQEQQPPPEEGHIMYSKSAETIFGGRKVQVACITAQPQYRGMNITFDRLMLRHYGFDHDDDDAIFRELAQASQASGSSAGSGSSATSVVEGQGADDTNDEEGEDDEDVSSVTFDTHSDDATPSADDDSTPTNASTRG